MEVVQLLDQPFQLHWIVATESDAAQRPEMSRGGQTGMFVAPTGPGAAMPVPGGGEIAPAVGQIAFEIIQRRGPRLLDVRQEPPSLFEQRAAKGSGFARQADVDDSDQGTEDIGGIGGHGAFVGGLQQGGQRQIVLTGLAQAVAFPQQRPRPLTGQPQHSGPFRHLAFESRGLDETAIGASLSGLSAESGERLSVGSHAAGTRNAPGFAR